MSLTNLSCAVLSDLGRHTADASRDERDQLAIEHEADLMLADIDCCRALGESFVEQLLSDAPRSLMDQFYLGVGQQMLRRFYDRNPMGAELSQLVRVGRAFVAESAKATLDKRVEGGGSAEDERMVA
ncbi:hypothetical protein JFK97_06635 [Chromobacterium phragmitis]|uniref:hypothetical protein n=1 Tax=Chromobacterium amazonense TaxID=1382803 RepID=UPI0021B72B00|nr:hypothetical protein [Chromobacterium amazonense]MBM2884063.1 hypothetical protein [Chromobacterium amazonense]